MATPRKIGTSWMVRWRIILPGGRRLLRTKSLDDLDAAIDLAEAKIQEHGIWNVWMYRKENGVRVKLNRRRRLGEGLLTKTKLATRIEDEDFGEFADLC